MSEKKWIAFYPVCYRILYVILLSGVLMMGFGDFLGIRNIGGFHWLILMAIIGLLACFQHGKISAKVVAGVLLLLCMGVIIPLIGAGQIKDFWENYYLWLIVRKDFISEWVVGYELMQTVWVVLGCYIFQTLAQKIQIVKELSAVALVGALIACMILEKEVDHIGVALIVVYAAVCVSERIRLNWQKVKAEDKRGYIMWLAPFFLVYLLVLCSIPPKEDPYDWGFIRRAYGHIREKVVVWFEDANRNGREDFGSFLTGFSEEVEVGGNIKKDNRELMTVQGSGSLVTNLYLSGKAYDTFTGREWKQKGTEDFKEHPLDALELIYAVNRFDEQWMFNYVLDSRITLEYGHFDTGYLFAPLKTTYVKDTEYQIKGRDFTFGVQKGYGTTYGFLFYQINQKTPEFVKLIHTSLPEDEDVWETVVSRFAPDGMKDLSLEDLYKYRQDMQETYFDEVELSPQVEAYLQEITKDCATPYERLQAIEKELSGFVYNTNPGKLPQGVRSEEEFLDYFLLESKQGYCTYFATTFVLLARAEGFPARYVEGFCVPVNQSKEMRVTSGMAHAWPEVYIEGIGWLPFEPTPGYANLRYLGWQVRKPQIDFEDHAVKNPPTPAPLPALEEEEPEKEKKEGIKGWITLLKVIGIIVPVCMLLLFLEKLRQKRIYKQMSCEQKFVAEVKRNLWILAKAGYKREDFETLAELRQRISKELPELFETKEDWNFLTEYEQYLYGEEKVSEELLKDTIAKKEEILLWLKTEDKKYYMWIKLLLFVSGY